MSAAAIAQTTEKTHMWLNELAEELQWDEPDLVFCAFRAVLHQLRDRLPINESAQLASQLPLLVCGIYYENWNPREKPEKLNAEAFAERIAAEFPGDFTIDPAAVVRAVFGVLAKHVSAGEISDVQSCLPKDYKAFWN